MRIKKTSMTIGRQVSLAFAIVLAFLAATTAMSWWSLAVVNQKTRDMMAQPLAKERLISDWYRNVDTDVRRTAAIAVSTDSSVSDFFAAEIADASRSSAALRRRIEPLLASDAEQRLLREIAGLERHYADARDRIAKAKAAASLFEAGIILEKEFMPASVRYRKAVSELLDLQRRSIDAGASDVAEIAATNRLALLAAGMLALAAGGAGAFFIVRNLLRRLGGEPAHAAEVAAEIARGNLAVDVGAAPGDEVSLLAAIGRMRDGLAAIVTEVRRGTEAIHHGSAEIAAGNLDLSARTERQAGSLGETAASMAQLTATVRQNAQDADHASELALAASRVAGEGGDAVSDIVNTMGDIHDASRRIAEIIGVIDGISFQTNILALNAAVEAARAGEQGRGFAVVAGEVRALAKRSADAAREIRQLIEDSVRKVDSGAARVEQAGGTMRQVVGSVREVTDLVTRIAAASHAQSGGIAEINQAIAQMDQATQQNAALVEQAAAAAASMREQAGRLAQAVNIFVTGGGQAAPALAAVTLDLKESAGLADASVQARRPALLT